MDIQFSQTFFNVLQRERRFVTFHLQAFFDREKDLTESKEPDNGNDKVKPSHEGNRTESHAQLAAHNIHANPGQNESEKDGDQRLESGLPSQPGHRTKGQDHHRGSFRGAELECELGKEGRKEGEYNDPNDSP